jgi:hypothetical protein
MDSRLIFLHCARRLSRDGRIDKPDPPVRRGGWGPRKGPARGQLVAEVWNAGAEKSVAGTKRASVLKLTQVGEESILRRSRELSLRN